MNEQVIQNDFVVHDGQNLPDFFVVGVCDLKMKRRENGDLAEEGEAEVLHTRIVLEMLDSDMRMFQTEIPPGTVM